MIRKRLPVWLENRAAHGQADEVVVGDVALVGVELLARHQAHDEAFLVGRDEQDQLAGLGGGHGWTFRGREGSIALTGGGRGPG